MRTVSSDYEAKKAHLLNVAASMFAELGFVGCKMEDIAAKCNVSKSMLYHYFKRKEDVLYEILRDHVTALNDTIQNYLDRNEESDRLEFFYGFIETYLGQATKARERHAVTLNDTRWLTHDQMMLQEELERKNLNLIVAVLKRVNPEYTTPEYRVYALFLIGIMNWVELWYRPSGMIPRLELYDRISNLFLNGFIETYEKRKKQTSAKIAKADQRSQLKKAPKRRSAKLVDAP